MYQQIEFFLTKLFELFFKYFIDFIKSNRQLIENASSSHSYTSSTQYSTTSVPNIAKLFIEKLNELDSVKTLTNYEYPLNGGTCWNCKKKEHSHSCCIACKEEADRCKCKFICGLTYPTQFDKHE
ncbi:6888_t:CDS:1 [Cetraspora pellucida]|uniref:6888_t:CDS:1 n=1 Tax=Cetraspora pellucida TaxID=1433469 RepID=A0A9N8YY14_9GLOM|nr:6888_t:CDS:1 [Cetraspora pellucida]